MSTTGLITAILLTTPTLIAAYLGLVTWNKRRISGAISFSFMMLVIGSWSFCALMVVIAPSEDIARFWMQVSTSVIPFLPVFILATCAQSMGRAELFRMPHALLWFVIPTISAILGMTSTSHQLYFYNVRFVWADGHIIGWMNDLGVWTVVHLAYSYLLVGYGLLLLVEQFRRVRIRMYRVRIVLLIVGLSISTVINFLNSVVSPVHSFSNPIAFNIVSPILYWVVIRYRLFDLAPIAREQAFEQMQDAIVILDANEQVVDANQSAIVLAGQPLSSLIGKSLDLIYPSLQAGLRRALSHASEKTSFQISDANRRFFDVRISEITRNHMSVGKIIILHDATEQQLAANRLQRMEIENERIRSLAEFTSVASHEFRTPLSIIRNAAYMIDRLDNSEKRKEKTALIDSQVVLMTGLVEALLMMVKLRSETERTLSAIQVNLLIQSAVEKFSAKAAARSQRIDLHLAANLPAISGDEEYLEAAIDAVLNNAIRFTPEGGTITLRTHRQQANITITVADTGIGIAPEHLPHIFDVFYRVDQAHTTAGFGMGLAIARRALELHHGTIQATSEPGAGTTIEMRLPLAPPSS